MTVCIQCALRALVRGEAYVPSAEEPNEHMLLHHPDPVETQRERIELEEAAAKIVKERMKS